MIGGGPAVRAGRGQHRRQARRDHRDVHDRGGGGRLGQPVHRGQLESAQRRRVRQVRDPVPGHPVRQAAVRQHDQPVGAQPALGQVVEPGEHVTAPGQQVCQVRVEPGLGGQRRHERVG